MADLHKLRKSLLLSEVRMLTWTTQNQETKKAFVWERGEEGRENTSSKKQAFPANASQGLMFYINSHPHGGKHYNP